MGKRRVRSKSFFQSLLHQAALYRRNAAAALLLVLLLPPPPTGAILHRVFGIGGRPTPSWSGSHRRSSGPAHCNRVGGRCETMFSCLLSSGGVATHAKCGGIFNVCCAQQSSATGGGEFRSGSTRYFRENTGGSSSLASRPPQSRHKKRPQSRHKTRHQKQQQQRSSASAAVGRKFPELHHGPVINDPQCGRPPSASTEGTPGLPVSANRRVLDGQPAGFGTFPWQALIRIGKGKCGGVLINRRHVVTAGHCIKNKAVRGIHVTLGEYHLKQKEPYPSQEFRVTRAAVHPKFQFSPAADRFDVAVLTLDRNVRYAPHISPICLPEAGKDPDPGTNAYVAGWGALVPDDVSGPLIQFLVPEIKRPSVLQVVNVPVLENARCERWHQNAGIKVRIWNEMVCAGYRQGGKDSCKGDSGGPLMVQQADGRWVLIGLVSAGFSCGKPGQPGIYHRISATSDWITKQAYNHLFY